MYHISTNLWKIDINRPKAGSSADLRGSSANNARDPGSGLVTSEKLTCKAVQEIVKANYCALYEVRSMWIVLRAVISSTP